MIYNINPRVGIVEVQKKYDYVFQICYNWFFVRGEIVDFEAIRG